MTLLHFTQRRVRHPIADCVNLDRRCKQLTSASLRLCAKRSTLFATARQPANSLKLCSPTKVTCRLNSWPSFTEWQQLTNPDVYRITPATGRAEIARIWHA